MQLQVQLEVDLSKLDPKGTAALQLVPLATPVALQLERSSSADWQLELELEERARRPGFTLKQY